MHSLKLLLKLVHGWTLRSRYCSKFRQADKKGTKHVSLCFSSLKLCSKHFQCKSLLLLIFYSRELQSIVDNILSFPLGFGGGHTFRKKYDKNLFRTISLCFCMKLNKELSRMQFDRQV